jgi:hypothetical protein
MKIKNVAYRMVSCVGFNVSKTFTVNVEQTSGQK